MNDGRGGAEGKAKKKLRLFFYFGSDATKAPPDNHARGGENYVNTERRELTLAHCIPPMGRLIGRAGRASFGRCGRRAETRWRCG